MMTIQRLFLAATALLAGCAAAPTGLHALATPADVPPTLRPAPGQEPFLQLHATGVQIYECMPPGNGRTAWAWQFKSPEAMLADTAGVPVVHHFAGPSWASNDGATIVGQLVASAPAVEAGSIPWLLLTVKSRDGQGLLAPATSVQRLATAGGVAPSWPCSTTNAHQVQRVGYTATYVFWRSVAAGRS